MKEIILASTSKYRKELLSRLNITFTSCAPQVNEDLFKKENHCVYELAKTLSYEKAKAIFSSNKNQLVIGSDQICHLNGKILSKPGNFENAIKSLQALQGKRHELITAYTIITDEKVITKLDITTLHMRAMNDESIKNYLELDQPFDCAGSYKLELKGISLFEKIESNDHTAIIGLPLIELSNDLIKLNVNFFNEGE